MTHSDLAKSYVKMVRRRIKAIELLLSENGFADVIRETQESYELLMKAVLRYMGIDPPKLHDVGPFLRQFEAQIPISIRSHLDRICTVSMRLRKERELAFYGDLDFIPDDSYTHEEAKLALDELHFFFDLVCEQYDL